jgi:hypothetical protein
MCSPAIQCTYNGLKQVSNNEERVRLGQFLICLNETYSVVRGQIMFMHPLPTIKKAYSLLREEEKQRGLVEHKITKRVYAMNVKLSDSAS